MADPIGVYYSCSKLVILDRKKVTNVVTIEAVGPTKCNLKIAQTLIDIYYRYTSIVLSILPQ
ncbi:hypothetical protein V1478_009677 [Vespula squamosa]|uniref:Uncharacterized protein n=1 Tax=Vespula squamosa TaxID=30214 RepID=A0ABD2AQD3_VESSQ